MEPASTELSSSSSSSLLSFSLFELPRKSAVDVRLTYFSSSAATSGTKLNGFCIWFAFSSAMISVPRSEIDTKECAETELSLFRLRLKS